MTSTRVISLDTETTGLDYQASVWEIAACPWDPYYGPGEVASTFVQPNDPDDYKRLPRAFREDYEARYNPETALTKTEAVIWLEQIFAPGPDGQKPMLIGAVPCFDERVLRQSLPGFTPPWHYHVQDVETAAVGYLRALERLLALPGVVRDGIRRVLTPPYDSAVLSRALGVEPPGPGSRHTAGGDARWAATLWDVVHRGDPRGIPRHWEYAGSWTMVGPLPQPESGGPLPLVRRGGDATGRAGAHGEAAAYRGGIAGASGTAPSDTITEG